MNLKFTSKNWWETDTYSVEELVPPQLVNPELWGERGPAIVRAYQNGSTQPGWGPGKKDERTKKMVYEFMPNYLKGDFLPRRVEPGYDVGRHAAAYVMRSGSVIVIDIDGKNGGLEHAGELGALPYTLAETSKSGNGYHLWYYTMETLDPNLGFAEFGDYIGVVTGVDIKAVGCVYHWHQQRWNQREMVRLPKYLEDQLRERKARKAATAAAIATTLAQADEMEILIMKDQLIKDLAKPIPAGQRNNTLFAIGSQMKQAQVDAWDEKIRVRAEELGLDADEIEKLVGNIEVYV